MVDLKKSLIASGWITGIAYVLGLIYSRLFANGLATIQFALVDVNVKNQILGGVDTTLAGKILAYFAGIIPLGEGLAAVMTMYVASLIIVYFGALTSEKFAIGKTDTQRFGIGMGIVAVIIGAIVGGMSISIGALGGAIAMLFYFVIIVSLYGLVRTKTGLGNAMPLP